MATKAVHQQEYPFSFPERALLLLAVLLIFFVAYVWTAKTSSLRRLFFPASAEEAFLSKSIGKVIAIRGVASRQRAADTEFTTLTEGEDLYPDDTLMTGPETTVIVELADGTRFEMGATTLIKLAFEFDFSVRGLVERKLAFERNVVQVITGSQVKALSPVAIVQKQAKAAPAPIPTPTPTPIVEEKAPPLQLSDLTPSPRSQMTLSLKDAIARKISVPVGFKLNQQPPAQLTVRVLLAGTSREVASAIPTIQDVTGSAPMDIRSPGNYDLVVQDPEGKILGKTDFRVNPVAPVLETLPTMGGDNRLEGFAAKKQFDGFVLRWKPIPGSARYVIKIHDPQSNRVLLTKDTAANQLVLNRNKILLGKMYYTVEKSLGNGFTAVSGKENFSFAFMGPELGAPGQNVIFTRENLAENNDTIFFTWSKTNYTNSYEFELASDPAFAQLVIKRAPKDNFHSVLAPQPGKYYWRVRSVATEAVSPFSEVRTLTVNP